MYVGQVPWCLGLRVWRVVHCFRFRPPFATTAPHDTCGECYYHHTGNAKRKEARFSLEAVLKL